MEINEAVKFITKEINVLEKATYMYDNVMRPRAEADKKILVQLREQLVRLSVLQEKVKSGEQVTRAEIMEAVPEALR
jgi:conjugal transfer/entry exclusion protein